jgi:hypothetical protein
VSDKREAVAVLPSMARLFLGQGYSESSTEAPFEDYLGLGPGKTPMLLTYEWLFLDRQIRNDGSITKEMVLLYPTPDVLSKHTVLALTENGDKAGQLISENADLQRLAAKYGFRTTNPSTFHDVLTSSGVALPPDLMNIVDPPRYELLEYMIATLEKQYLEHTREITPTQSNRHAHGRDATTRDTRHGLQSAVRQAGLEARSVDRTIRDHAATARRLEQPITLRVLAGSEVKDMAELVEEASKATNVRMTFEFTGTLDGYSRRW